MSALVMHTITGKGSSAPKNCIITCISLYITKNANVCKEHLSNSWLRFLESWSLHYGSITPVGMRIERMSTFTVPENVKLTRSFVSDLCYHALVERSTTKIIYPIIIMQACKHVSM